MKPFAHRVIAWQHTHGRHGLPWQGADVYRVWLSEIMLQQTQVATVIPYYQRFVAAFPDIACLAAADENEVLTLWSGLGYYARGRNLHRAARIIMEQHGGVFPHDFEHLLELPGIGRSTAAAICALARHERRAILDGNVKRVLARHRGIEGWPGNKKVENRLWQLAEALLPEHDVAVYTQGLMDLGASVCTRSKPLCGDCPVCNDCIALNSRRTGDLPAPRPNRNTPERSCTMLLLRSGSDILLERRPGSGIWGGLWCLPQFDDEQAALTWCSQLGLNPDRGDSPAPFTHAFTHFRLCIKPLLLESVIKPLQAAQSGSQWMTTGDALESAIPSPVRNLILQVTSES